MFAVYRASEDLMPIVCQILNNNYDLYKNIVAEQDLNEHNVGEKWAKRNFLRREFYLARAEGNFVGTASYQKIDRIAYIGYFYIDNNSQRKGFGKSLMGYMWMRAKTDNVNRILLFANSKADWALSFYKKLGFKIILTERDDIHNYNNGCLKDYYEEGSYLLERQIGDAFEEKI